MSRQVYADVLFMRGNLEEAANIYYEQARDGDARSSFNYAYCLLFGYGVERNPKKAKSFFAFAGELEGGEAYYNLAVMYMHGEGVTRDYKKAFKYMKSSASLGCVEAQLYLGMVYTTGYLLEPDIVCISIIPFHKPIYRNKEGFFLCGEVSDAEADEEARFSVVSADQHLAFEWFRKAAHHDPTYVSDLVAKGQFLYAKCYIDGLGTDFNRVKGLRLMLTAGKSGSSEALNYLTENGITKEMLLEEKNVRRKNKPY